MRKICHNTSSAIYEDGDNWVWKAERDDDQIIPKDRNPYLPLSAVIKYEMIEDDKAILDELRNKALANS
jgi:hypothetical protein